MVLGAIIETILAMLILFGMSYFVIVVVPVTTKVHEDIETMSARIKEDIEISQNNFALSKRNGEQVTKNHERLATLAGDLKAFVELRSETKNREAYLSAHKETQRMLKEMKDLLEKKVKH
jgi:F0F1-type ATP synthase membrane subunit b/b'